ncbi:TGF-beta-activated kinase 1 and MAP3K7-binding protein like [Actinidia chinensis var. chinensis]|uniref:TGF-beta-activated kinase 1 and MAP3K7-binding protein like n=1 Tax=Actinidia chinensis var. chinensis TaxID=1590841 RepID=A0A2R6PA34_ACTCC|nr:TGF-beta-activated kinase 1 and MAP3K7-binding protein like [Actinidia chinensis var. chinensis]
MCLASSSSLLSFRSLMKPILEKRHGRPSLQIRSQGFRDEGRSGIDANLRVLRERIEEVRMRERLERCWRNDNIGWNYAPAYDYKHKRSMVSSQFYEIFGLVFGTFGLTIVSGTFFLCLVSLLVHLNQ